MKKWKIESNNEGLLGAKDVTITYNPIAKENNQKDDCSIWVKLVTGSIIGFVNGFWGGGGGMICVPLLMRIIKLPEKKSHATTLLIMLPLCISSLVVYILNGNLQIEDSIRIGIGFIVGGIIGAYLLKIINNTCLGVIFSIIIIVGGIKLLI